MKAILLPLIFAGVTVNTEPRDKSKESRKTSAGTYWTEDTVPPPISVPEPKSPLVVLTIAGVAILMTRNKPNQ